MEAPLPTVAEAPQPAAPPRPQAVPSRAVAERPAPLPAAVPFETVVAMQAALDRANYSPGCISGEIQDQFTAALRYWQKARGLPVTGEIDEPTLRRLGETRNYFTTHRVSAPEMGSLSDVPRTWPEKAARTRLGYQTILELVAEKYHATEALVLQLNPRTAWPNPPVGSTLRVPHPAPARHVDIARLEIDLSGNELNGYDKAGQHVLFYPCSIAQEVDKRPVGTLRVANAASHPNYTFDPAVFVEDPEAQAVGRKLLIPPGPNNPVGVGWLGLDRSGYGIHGTAWPEDIGKTQSHGCFRLANWNIEKLIRFVKIGTPVVVRE